MIKSTIRLDVLGESTEDRLESFLTRYEKYLIYEEVADKTKKIHYQGVIYVNDDKAYGAMKTRFCTHFKEWPKGTKSMALVKKDTYEVYISKDKNPKYVKNFSDEDIKDLQDKSYKKDKKDNGTLIENVEKAFDQYLIDRKHARGDFIVDKHLTINDIEEFLVKQFFDMKKHWDTGVIAKYRNYLHYKTKPDEHMYMLREYRRW